jgi:methylenetetrahydrofolate dehydrogenase (NADP+)/methenyltetrahydrofolate cyclohydrolase
MARILDGAALAAAIKQEVAEEVGRLAARGEFDRFFKGDVKRETAFARKGFTLVADIDPRAFELAGAYTLVPGGVGLLTVAMLMANTVCAAKMRRGLTGGGLS